METDEVEVVRRVQSMEIYSQNLPDSGIILR